jgi:hypothetical protein
MAGPYTVDIEVTPQEKQKILEALRTLAEQEAEKDNPGEADRIRGLAMRIE